MTSIGAEWDTNVLVYLPDNKLPPGVQDRVPFFNSHGISMTLESWHQGTHRGRDCLVSLEVQLGVFESPVENKFNRKDLINTCKIFAQIWRRLMKSKKIKIGERTYDLLVHVPKPSPNLQLYKDCGRTIKENADKGGYTDAELSARSIGNPQLTVGIKLVKIISLFAFMSELYVEKTDNPVLIIQTMYNAYSSAGLYADSIGLRDLNTIAFLILVAYYVYVSYVYKSIRKGYVKASFAFLPRTNIRMIYARIGKPKDILTGFISYLSKEDGDLVPLLEQFSIDFFNPKTAYVVETTGKRTFPRLALAANAPAGVEKRAVKAFVPWWTTQFPSIRIRGNVLEYEPGHQHKMDFGSWILAPQNTVYMEFRAMAVVLGMIVNYPAPKLRAMSVKKFCPLLSFVVKNILEKALSIDPSVILRPEE